VAFDAIHRGTGSIEPVVGSVKFDGTGPPELLGVWTVNVSGGRADGMVGDWATDIHHDGEMVRVVGVGDDWRSFGSGRAFLWELNLGTGETRMLRLGLAQDGFGLAHGVNRWGEVVCNLAVGGQLQAHLWRADGRVRDLGGLGGERSVAFSVDDAGQIVGWAQAANGEARAFLSRAGEDVAMLDLNELTIGEELTLTSAWQINETGQILAQGMERRGAVHVLLTPIQVDPEWSETFQSAVSDRRSARPGH
jgi:probable HAF family extracellular repeat protein